MKLRLNWKQAARQHRGAPEGSDCQRGSGAWRCATNAHEGAAATVVVSGRGRRRHGLQAHDRGRRTNEHGTRELDRLAASAFDGYLVRRIWCGNIARQYPVPTYVVEFLLGRYCASVDEQEIAEGLQIVEKQLRDRTVRTGEEELFKARAKEQGSVKHDRHRRGAAGREERLLRGRAAEPRAARCPDRGQTGA